VKIATFNINGINRRLRNLTDWLAEAEPDVVCLQELKATERQLPLRALEAAGYGVLAVAQASWNGVAILARDAEPVPTALALPGTEGDGQARYVEAAVNGVLIGCLYAPNGNPRPGPKFAHKLAWTDRLVAHGRMLIETGAPVVLAGDFNIVPEPRDIYPTTSYRDNALVQPEARERYAALLAQGWTDAIRQQFPDETVYTFWDYMRQRWPRDAGLRLDHILLAPALAGRLRDAGVDRAVRGRVGASDHAPVWVEIDA
jgi:exodeoxyribonuclease-3